VCLIGPPGSGRTTLINELLDFARREQLQVHRATPSFINRTRSSIINDLKRRPFVLGLDHNSPDLVGLCQAITANRLVGYTLIRATQPIPGLPKDSQLHLPPLTHGEVSALLPQNGKSKERVDHLLRLTQGRPGPILDVLLRAERPTDLSAEEYALLVAAGRAGRPVKRLALRLGTQTQRIESIASELIARGLMERVPPDRLAAKKL